MCEYDILIMAAGLGKRMNSDIPKPIFPLSDKPMLMYLIETIYNLKNKPENTYIITNNIHSKIIKDTCKNYSTNISSKRTISKSIMTNIHWLEQDTPPMGTGDTVRIAIEKINPNSNKPLIILSADVPMISGETIEYLVEKYYNTPIIKEKAIILAINNETPHGYGRIILNNNEFIKIVEQKDANEAEQEITLVNTGIYCISYNLLKFELNLINNNNASGEYYLTDLFSIAKDAGASILINTLESHLGYQVFNVNTIRQIQELEDMIEFNNTFN